MIFMKKLDYRKYFFKRVTEIKLKTNRNTYTIKKYIKLKMFIASLISLSAQKASKNTPFIIFDL